MRRFFDDCHERRYPGGPFEGDASHPPQAIIDCGGCLAACGQEPHFVVDADGPPGQFYRFWGVPLEVEAECAPAAESGVLAGEVGC